MRLRCTLRFFIHFYVYQVVPYLQISLQTFVCIISSTPALCPVRTTHFDFVGRILLEDVEFHIHTHSLGLTGWKQLTSQWHETVPPCRLPEKFLQCVVNMMASGLEKGVGFTTNKSQRRLTLKWNTNFLRLFQANAGSLHSQRSHHGSSYDIWFVCVCVYTLVFGI
jgi:hypothetical protein